MTQEKIHSQTDTTQCSWADCCAEGVHPAPKSPANLQDKHMLCLEHVRLYNSQWNYFVNMAPEEIEAFQKESFSGHRPTGKMGVEGYHYDNEEKLRQAVFSTFRQQNQAPSSVPTLPKKELDALNVLGLEPPVDWKKVKKTYKALAKTYHPDINGSADEERIKVINQAYSHLKSVYSGN